MATTESTQNSVKKNELPRVLFALPVVGQPRHAKRISMLSANNRNVSAAAFEREYHRGREPDCNVHLLGKIEKGSYLKRSFRFLQAIPVMRKLVKECDVVYAFGADMALLSMIAGLGLSRPVFYEVGDLRPVQVSSSLQGFVTRQLDRYISKNCKLIIATTGCFVDQYYRSRLKVETDALVIENKMEPTDVENYGSHFDNSLLLSAPQKIRIGYFGLLRCEWTWRILEKIAIDLGELVEIHVAGYPFFDIDVESCVESHFNMFYHGPYRSPEDLPELYQKVDLVWAAYPAPNDNAAEWQWAQQICRSNRFYESCCFQRPLISIAKSGDGRIVSLHEIGLLLKDLDGPAIVSEIKKLTRKQIEEWVRNIDSLPKSVYTLTEEADELNRKVDNSIVKK